MKMTKFYVCDNSMHVAFSAPRIKLVSIYVMLALISGINAQAFADDYFDPSLLQFGAGNTQSVDLSQFGKIGGQAEGTYNVDVYVNNQFIGARSFNFVHDTSKYLVPVLTPADLDDWGVNLKSVDALSALQFKDTLPLPLTAYIPDASARLDFSQMRLLLSVPQLNMKHNQDTLADPSMWQEGDTAFLLNYNLSGNTYQTKNDGSKSDSQGFFGTFQSGLNYGPWRLRNNSTYTYSQQKYDVYESLENTLNRTSQSQRNWTSQQTYLQRDIAFLRSQLMIGETSTGRVASQILDGFSYRGVALMSSDAMLPGGMNGFAPVITGIASSNAQVTVTQNGAIIYQANVSPGPFRFTDITGSGTSGDLKVSIRESDGSVHGFNQPYSSLPVMQRQGQLRYEMAAGQYYIGRGGYTATGTPGFASLSAIYGLPWDLTIYGGLIGANDYNSLAIGSGFSLSSYGAVSLDATHSHAKLSGDNKSLTGESYRARYSKSMMITGTTVDLTAYRYSTRNYLSFNDANNRGYNTESGLPDWLNARRRSTYEIRLNQTLWDNHQLWVSGHRDNYWGSGKTNTNMTAGLSGAVQQVGWSLSYSIDRLRGNGDWPENRQWALTMNVPMSLFGSAATLQNSYLTYSLMHDNNGRSNNQLTMGGALLEDNSVSWSLSQSMGNQGRGNNGSASLGYNDSWGSANLGYNYDSNGGRGITYSANGALLAHRHGLTMTPYISDAAIVVHTGVPGVKVMNGGVTTDRWGNAVVSGVRTYNRNNISIDPTSLPDGANPPASSHALYPTAGAILIDRTQIRLGQQVLMNIFHNGKPVPFGSIATLKGETDLGSIVGEGGQVYLGGMPENGTLHVKWGTTPDSQCQALFTLPKPVQRSKKDARWHPIETVDVNCR